MTYASSSDVKDLLNIDQLDSNQVDLALKFADNRVDDQITSASKDDKEEAATYMAAHVCKLMLRTGSTVVKDGDLELEEIEDGETMYSSMFNRVVKNHGGTLFGRVG